MINKNTNFNSFNLNEKPDLLIIAGEHSGDEHAANLLLKTKQEFFKRNGRQMIVYALGGQKLKEAGASLLFDMTSFSVVGFIEVLKNYSFFKELLKKTLNWIEENNPQKICFVDYPGFNLALAKMLFERKLSAKAGASIKLFYYISPQIWAWKSKRRFKMEKYIDSLAVIFPFEVDCYKDTSLPVHFIGHPFCDENKIKKQEYLSLESDTSKIKSSLEENALSTYKNTHSFKIKYDKDAPILLLPGSRDIAISRILPVLLKVLSKTDKKAIVFYPKNGLNRLEKILNEQFAFLKERVDFIFADSAKELPVSAAIMSSGTMSLEVCLAKIPSCIVYKANILTWIIGRALVKGVKYLGIANILLDKPAIKEFLQIDANPKKISNYLNNFLLTSKAQTLATQNAKNLENLLSSKITISPQDWLLS